MTKYFGGNIRTTFIEALVLEAYSKRDFAKIVNAPFGRGPS